MADRAPPFSALRALEAASRHRSFTWAAKELNITHSAVSQSIRRLEADLGATLFERKGGRMEPSEAALRLAQTYSDAAESLGQALREITGRGDVAVLSVGMPSDFARLWFASKMARLSETLPDLRVVVATGPQRDSQVELLFTAEPRSSDEVLSEVQLLPLCAPAFAAGHDLSEPDRILAASLLADQMCSWRLWASRLSPASPPPQAHIFDDAALPLEAAAGGGGVALSHQFAAEPYVTSGRLVALPFATPAEERLVLRLRSGDLATDLVGRFVMWMKLEIGRSAARLRGL